MRLWSFAPEYLDAYGLVALWREALLAQKVLADETVGYRRHPQLERFRAAPDPLDAIGAYLDDVWREATRRGYRFERAKIRRIPEKYRADAVPAIPIPEGQLEYERLWFLEKARRRAPKTFELRRRAPVFRVAPTFALVPGGVATWERPDATILATMIKTSRQNTNID